MENGASNFLFSEEIAWNGKIGIRPISILCRTAFKAREREFRRELYSTPNHFRPKSFQN